VLRIQLLGANPAPRYRSERKLPGEVSYLRGQDRRKWRSGLPTYAAVRREAVYPGIDQVHYGRQRQLEYDFVVKPGADPAAIRVAFRGAEGLRIDQDGGLVLSLPGGQLRQAPPVVYQEVSGRRRQVAGAYRLCADGAVGFRLGKYDRHRTLVIDPVISYLSYLGGTGEDWAAGIAVDRNGSAYVTGYTGSTDFPTSTNPFQDDAPRYDVFVTKFSPFASTIAYSTYLGGSSDDYAAGIALDRFGSAYITGTTFSTDFPTENAYDDGSVRVPDVFVTRLGSSGRDLYYSTYLSGEGSDYGTAIVTDGFGKAFVTGYTDSLQFPLQRVDGSDNTSNAGGTDAFVSEINTNDYGPYSLDYSRYFGGSEFDSANGIAVDSAGSLYIAGETSSIDLPTEDAAQTTLGGDTDAFVAKLGKYEHAVFFCSYLGGEERDFASAIALDGAGEAFIAGTTSSADFPLANAAQSSFGGNSDGFVARFSRLGDGLIYSTYLGGTFVETIYGIAVEEQGGAWVAGYTNSSNFPVKNAVQQNASPESDAFVTRFDADGSGPTFSTYLGGSSSDGAAAVTRDRHGAVWVAGWTLSTLPVTPEAYQATPAGALDTFVVQLAVEPSPPTNLTATPVSPLSINLTWTDTSENEEGYVLERKTGAGGAFRRIRQTGADTSAYLDSGRNPGTTYTYRIRSFTASNPYTGPAFSAYSAEASATGPALLSRPADLAVTALSATELKLTWKDTAAGEYGYEVQQRRVGEPFERIALLPANTQTYTDAYLRPDTKYIYRVRAYLGTHVSRFSNQAHRNTKRVPKPPSHVLAVAKNATDILVTWLDRSTTETGFVVVRGSDFGEGEAAFTTNANVTSFLDGELTPSTTYYYTVQAVSGTYVSDADEEASATTFAAPPPPTNLTVTGVTSSSVALSWKDASTTETGFRVERSTDGVTFATVTTTAASSGSGKTVRYTDSTVTHLTTYTYRVRSISGSYVSSPGNTVTANP
jgi:hypothetical protein